MPVPSDIPWRAPSQRRPRPRRVSRSHRAANARAAAPEPAGRSSPGEAAGKGQCPRCWARTAQTPLRQHQPPCCVPGPVGTHLCGAASPGRAVPAGRRGRGPAGGSGAAAGGRPRRRRRERSRDRAGPSRGSARNSGTCSRRDGTGRDGAEPGGTGRDQRRSCSRARPAAALIEAAAPGAAPTPGTTTLARGGDTRNKQTLPAPPPAHQARPRTPAGRHFLDCPAAPAAAGGGRCGRKNAPRGRSRLPYSAAEWCGPEEVSRR